MLHRIRSTEPDFRARLEALANRTSQPTPELDEQVRRIIAAVRQRGDAAVAELTEKLDGKAPTERGGYEVTKQRWDAIARRLDETVAEALQFAGSRIQMFHQAQTPSGYTAERGQLALRVEPLWRVGIYVPGGTAIYPSSVLMTAIPARIAGVREVIMVSPGVTPETLAAARIAGVHRVFEIGGAQAIAALAYGTETVPRVDKIVGPGNQWVAAAKRQVFGQVDIDSIAGPSEIVIVADETANPAWVAADLLAQAEHDVEARPVLVTTSKKLADDVDRELEKQINGLRREQIARASVKRNGLAIVVRSIDQAIKFVNTYAPEHVQLCVERATEASYDVRCAGAIFIGSYSPEAAGDYLAGPNHVLPTGGTARYASPLGVYDFCKYISVINYGRQALADIHEDIVRLAEVEGLDAHARSITIRFAARRARTEVLPPDDGGGRG